MSLGFLDQYGGDMSQHDIAPKITQLAELAFNTSNTGDIANVKIPANFISEFSNLIIKEFCDKTAENNVIANQAKDIYKMYNRVKELEDALKNINRSLICIGGPLNDNVKNYSADQLKLFFKINDIIEGTL